MRECIREYINDLFSNAPHNRMVDEVREELCSGCLDKYDDLIKKGTPENEAYNIVISGIGDVDELINSLDRATAFDAKKIADNRTKRALFISVAVALYIIAMASLILLSTIPVFGAEIGLVSMFVIAAIATGIIIYGNISTASPYTKREDTIVENVKEQISGNDKESRFRKALSSTMWTLIVVVYLAVSFLTHWWHITWIIFIIGGLIENIIQFAVFRKPGALYGILWTGITIFYFVYSLSTWNWAWSWLVFPLGAAIMQVIRLVKLWRELE